MELIKPGTKVKIGEHGSQEAVVNAVSILGTECLVTYSVYWWSGSERHEIWVNHQEVHAEKGIETIEVKLSMS